MEIYDYKNQKISRMVVSYFICDHCNYVESNLKLMEVGTLCKNCGHPSIGGKAFFKLQIYSLIDLIQEFYNLESNDMLESSSLYDKGDKKKFAIVIFYTTIGEILLDQFLENLMDHKIVPVDLQDKLFSDYQSLPKKLELYKTFTKSEIKKDAESLSDNSYNFKEIISSYIKIRDARNKFLHKGYSSAISSDMPQKCLEQIFGLLKFFVSLNNKYIVQNT